MLEFYLFPTLCPASSTKKQFLITNMKEWKKKKKGKNAKAGRPLVNSYIYTALRIIPNVGYEARCYKIGDGRGRPSGSVG